MKTRITLLSLLLVLGLVNLSVAAEQVRYIGFNIYDPVYVAVDQKLFPDEIQVTVINLIAGGPTAVQAVATGEAEAGLASVPALYNAVTAGIPVIGVTDLQSSFAESPLETFYVRAADPIQQIRDLAGKRLAVNLVKSSFHYTLQIALMKANVSFDAVTWVTLPFDQQPAALLNDQVDLIGLMEPYATKARRMIPTTQMRQLFTASDVWGKKQFGLHFVNAQWAVTHPRAAVAFVSGIVRAVAWMQVHQPETQRIMAAALHMEVDDIPSLYRYQPDARINETDIAWWGQTLGATVSPSRVATNLYNIALRGK